MNLCVSCFSFRINIKNLRAIAELSRIYSAVVSNKIPTEWFNNFKQTKILFNLKIFIKIAT